MASSSSPLLHAGWGIKLSFTNKTFQNWKVRRFELTQTEFRYLNEKLELKKSLRRGQIVFAESVDSSTVPKASSFAKHYPFAVRMWLGQEPFFFCVASEEKREQWITALNNQQVGPSPNIAANRVPSTPPHKLK